jgi:glutathione S-transferase
MLTLFYHPLSSYCHKVLIALYENGTTFEKRSIDLGDPAQRAELQALWPLAKFPVIRDAERDRNVAETSVIIEYLDHYHGGRHPLLPPDCEAALEVRLWDRVFDNYVQGPMQQIVAERIKGSNADTSAQRALLQTAYRLIDSRLAGCTWISHHGFSMADCAAAPALFYAATLEPLPAELVQLGAYFDRLMERPSVRRVLEEARPYFPMYPFAEAIPRRFL